MSASQPTRRRAANVWRIARRSAALRVFHDEQLLMWELFGQSSWVSVDRTGPLDWEASLDGPRLAGSQLPIPDDASAAGRARKENDA